ncbi:MAG TPA: GC-type dockerin domain-anchored protein, partial [Phycisphaerales bacterium]|nr:GC-type dockerin domain-anchored protein [Phycisphaerales bacterium]
AVQLNTPPLSIGIGYDDEFWEESSIRFNRWTLEGVVSKNLDHLGGTDPACAAWIALPHQPLKNFGPWRGRAPVDGVNTDHYKYNGLLYTYGPQSPWFERGYVPTRQSVYATYRTLADARARGISEFFVWSNTGPDADAGFDETPAFHANGRWGNREGFDLHRGVHPDWPANWDLLHNAVNHVFNYDCASVVPQHGGTLVSPSTSAGALAALKYADEGATGFTAERSVRVHSALLTSTKRTGAVLVFGPRTDTGLPALGTSINLSVRAMPHFSRIAEEPPPNPAMQIGLEVFIHSGASGFWKNIDEPTSSTQDPSKTVELDGLMLLGGAVQAVEGRCINVRARIPFSRQPDQDEGSIGVVGTDGSIKMRVTLRFASGAAPAVEPVLIIDHATVYLSDEAYRDPTGAQSHSFLIPGDLNTDGTVDEKDNLLFEHLVSPGGNDTGMPGVPVAANAAKPAHRMFADFNRDGLITDTGSPGGLGDKYFWNRAGYLETLYVHGLDIVNPSNPVIMGLMNAKRIDAYRQSATEIPHPCPACRADIGVQGGTPGGDCVLDNNDFVVFIDYFFQQNAVADVGSQGGVTGPDGAWDNNDFVVFIDYFFNSVCD